MDIYIRDIGQKDNLFTDNGEATKISKNRKKKRILNTHFSQKQNWLTLDYNSKYENKQSKT